MAIVKPFKAVRPKRDKVALVSSKSYEVYSPAELGAKLDFNPFTFLHILDPEYKYHQKFSDEHRFKLVHNKYLEFKEKEIFTQDQIPSFYMYERTDKEATFCGFIAATSVDDYTNNVIKSHESTIHRREVLFEKYLKTIGFNAEPVLLTYEDNSTLENIMSAEKQKRPEYEFSTTDKKLHKLWAITDATVIAKITAAFQKIDSLYIADGHHRSASSKLLAERLTKNNENHTGAEAYNFFMSYIIPESHLQVSEFNRFITDLNGLSIAAFLLKLADNFTVQNYGQQIYAPLEKHHFSMYLNGAFYALHLKKERYQFTDSLSKLDSEILFQSVLKSILGVSDVTNNERIGYSNNKIDPLSIKTKVDDGFYKVGFGLLPISIEDIKEIADANLKMPPKTTYIEPKLRSGLTVYEF